MISSYSETFLISGNLLKFAGNFDDRVLFVFLFSVKTILNTTLTKFLYINS